MAAGDHSSAGRRKYDHQKSKNTNKRDGYDAKKRHFNARNRHGDSEPPSDTNYRNRALERSKLTDEYYKRIEEEYRLLKTQTEEESRYMGGDEEHTHLVKGLDYVLLQKVRKSLAPGIAAQKAAEAAAAASAANEETQHSDLGMYIYRTFFYHTHLQNRHFYERLNNTYRLLCKGYTFKRDAVTSKLYYTFDLCMEPGPNDIPSSVVCNDAPEHTVTTKGLLSAFLDPDIKKELFSAFEWHQENRKKKKEDRLPFRPEKRAEDSEAESDDIFAGAGEYRSDELNPEMVSKLNENEKYFVDSEDDEDTYTGAVQLPTFKRPKRTFGTSDGYDECYPDAGDGDSDDDGKPGKRKQKGNKGEWQKIEKIIEDKNAIPLDQLEQMTGTKKAL